MTSVHCACSACSSSYCVCVVLRSASSLQDAIKSKKVSQHKKGSALRHSTCRHDSLRLGVSCSRLLFLQCPWQSCATIVNTIKKHTGHRSHLTASRFAPETAASAACCNKCSRNSASTVKSCLFFCSLCLSSRRSVTSFSRVLVSLAAASSAAASAAARAAHKQTM